MKKSLSILLFAIAFFTTSFNTVKASPLLFFMIETIPVNTAESIDNQAVKKEKVSAFKEVMNTVKANKALLLTMGVFAFGAFVKKQLDDKDRRSLFKLIVGVLAIIAVIILLVRATKLVM